MTAFARIGKEDFLRRTIDIYIGDEHPHGYTVLLDGGTAQRTVSHDEDTGEPRNPTVRIREDQARALLDALVRYFGGAEDTRALRKDYDAERARVDRLIEKLSNTVVVQV